MYNPRASLPPANWFPALPPQTAMLSTQTFFFFPTAPFILFVFTASTIFHLHQRLEKMQPTWELEALEPATMETPSRPQPRPQLKGMWTINAIGRLGNQMGEYATLYALAKMNGRLLPD